MSVNPYIINVKYPSGRVETLSPKGKSDMEKRVAKIRAIYGSDVTITNNAGRRL